MFFCILPIQCKIRRDRPSDTRSGVAEGGGPHLAALLLGRHYALCCRL